ncbi:MAG TPA: hypothetical protein VEX35_06805 [Allosphingosinicella sp.]|nr:hypothetical protein [Allosphingosinicella sp.]
MVRELSLTCWAGIAALLLAPPCAAAQQPSPSATSDPEIFCVSDGLLQAAGRGGLDDAGIGALVSQCRQRFGWSENETRLGILVGRATIGMHLAIAEAGEAGVESSVISTVFQTFTDDELLGLQLDSLELAAGSQDIARQAAARIAERGLTGNAATKATRAVILALIAIRTSASFRAALNAGDGQ